MSFPTPPTFSNKLLSALPPAEMTRLCPLLTRVRLVSGQVLHEAGERVGNVFFIEQGFVASMAAEAEGDSDNIEVGLIGREGMAGYSALLGPEAVSYNPVVAPVPGSAFSLPAQSLRDSLGAMPVLRRLLFGAFEVFTAQVAQTAACNGRHGAQSRLVRWLLMAHDRVDGDELALTQQALSVMLAVRRSSVTIGLGSLQAAGLVEHRRGCVTILDRLGLEAAACGCYERVQALAIAVATRATQAPDLANPAP